MVELCSGNYKYIAAAGDTQDITLPVIGWTDKWHNGRCSPTIWPYLHYERSYFPSEYDAS